MTIKKILKCLDVKGCSAGYYLKCPAYKIEKSCWEVPAVPCCKRNNKERCVPCPVYLRAGQKEE
ncbi:hypothetical protein KKB54_03250 [bacterium]|nr:hypothetical protein [bacterium]MBU0899814.1 hypothetical protein [bacterium]MBU1152362.1 hypothetical protein [bacterium]MBU1782132.1 hypothetical protein [bacterium]MBU2599845.1 hypothetical protein [bacterium]